MPRRSATVLGVSLSTALVVGLLAGFAAPRSARPARHARAVAPARSARRAVRPARATSPPRRTAHAAARPGLSLSQLAGQRVIYAYSGLTPPAALFSVIRAGQAAGVILFGPNISSRSQIRSVITQLQHAAVASPVHERLLILTDQEGGEVRRLPGAPARSEKQIGAAPNGAALARQAGAGAGQNLRSVGINVNLAPVLDVYRQPGDFIDQFARSYSSRPGTAGALATSFIAAQQATGVAATAKHFPGLGAAAASENTDLRPVRLSQTLAALRSSDEAPYRPAIRAGVRLIMTSWGIYPALDPLRPAGLSPLVIQRELRAHLGFRGVTITDGIDAGAVTPFGSLARRSVLAAAAGADLILCAATNPDQNTPEQGITVLHALTLALADGRLGLASARASAARILALRR